MSWIKINLFVLDILIFRFQLDFGLAIHWSANILLARVPILLELNVFEVMTQQQRLYNLILQYTLDY